MLVVYKRIRVVDENLYPLFVIVRIEGPSLPQSGRTHADATQGIMGLTECRRRARRGMDENICISSRGIPAATQNE